MAIPLRLPRSTASANERLAVKTLPERLDALRELIQSSDFLEGKGLSNEVNIQIFCYDSSEEAFIQRFVKELLRDSLAAKLKCRLIECNIYRTFLEICDEQGITEEAIKLEERCGSEELVKQLHLAIQTKDFVKKIGEFVPHNPGLVLLLTGVGDAFPFMRVHSLLEALQPCYSDVPILVMYPGFYNNVSLKLFNKLEANNYYRAFNPIP